MLSIWKFLLVSSLVTLYVHSLYVVHMCQQSSMLCLFRYPSKCRCANSPKWRVYSPDEELQWTIDSSNVSKNSELSGSTNSTMLNVRQNCTLSLISSQFIAKLYYCNIALANFPIQKLSFLQSNTKFKC